MEYYEHVAPSVDFFNQSNCNQCSTECLFTLKIILILNWLPISINFTEVLLTYGIMTESCHVVSEEWQLLLDGFIIEVTNSCGFSFVHSYLMFLISLSKYFWSWRVVGSIDKIKSNSPFYVMWVVEFEVRRVAHMSRFLVLFCGQFGTPLHDWDIREWKNVIFFKFQCGLDGRPKAVEVREKLLHSWNCIWAI
jgi:hypothetical protein